MAGLSRWLLPPPGGGDRRLRLQCSRALRSDRTFGWERPASVLGPGSWSPCPGGADLLWGSQGGEDLAVTRESCGPLFLCCDGGLGRLCEVHSGPGPRQSRTPGPGDQSWANGATVGLKADFTPEPRHQRWGVCRAGTVSLGRRDGVRSRSPDGRSVARRQTMLSPRAGPASCQAPAGTGRW